MPHPFAQSTRLPRRAGNGVLLLVVCLALLSTGCRSMWNRVRENERNFAVETSRTQTGRGQCAQALASLDRAEARIDLGAFAREATIARTRCYEKLGLTELAAGHRRMMTDFYTDEPFAYPAGDGSSVFRVSSLTPGGYNRPPAWLKIPAPRYSEYARRSKIIGRVVVSFELSKNDQPRKIRVLEMPHPLLATWAIEAISTSKAKKKGGEANLMPGGRYVTTFLFEWRWAKEAPEEQLDS